MRLQRRLTLFFVLIVVLPLGAAGLFLQRVVVGEVERRAIGALSPVLDTGIVVYNNRAGVIDEQVLAAIAHPRLGELLGDRRTRPLETFLEDRLSDVDGADFLIVLDDKGEVIASARGPSAFITGVEPPALSQIVETEGTSGPGFNRTTEIPIRIRGRGVIGHALGGFWIDNDLLATAASADVSLSLVSDERILASTARFSGEPRIPISLGEVFEVEVGEPGKARAHKLPGNMSVVAVTPTAPIRELSQRVNILMALVMAVVLLLTGVLAYILARLLTEPLEELTEGARAISEGRYSHKIPVRSRDEVGQLAIVFNQMSAQLEQTISDLSSSRDQLQRAIRRVGETLRSTHDMKRILSSIINMTADAVTADAAVLWMLSPGRDELYPARTAGENVEELQRVKVGEGAVGFVAERGTKVLLPDPDGLRASRTEPEFPNVMAVPVYGQDRMLGVMAVYRGEESAPFSEGDMDTAVFLAQQGGVAIENVLLHEEARRLSITDGLTGVWNRRYFTMQFRQVLATSMRFDRSFTVLMLDLDHFKRINDQHGHQAGDAILVEFSQRVRKNLREVDTFARYGGEEFICLLTETDPQGALITAEKILEAVRREPFVVPGTGTVEVTVSIGISSFPEHGATLTTLIESADRALYRAKQDGRNRVVLADDSPPPTSGLRLAQ
ncbi:MAG TPA: diguanylate cyclase [Actinomycetota bacterium]|nr:diguanylate cyclase [Actinomycetota bacterium]